MLKFQDGAGGSDSFRNACHSSAWSVVEVLDSAIREIGGRDGVSARHVVEIIQVNEIQIWDVLRSR